MFPFLIVNNTVTPPWTYVREIGSDPLTLDMGDYSKAQPIFNPNSPEIVCNRDMNAGPKTKTATVLAGDELAFKADIGLPGIESTIIHEGPGSVYMSRAPNDDVENYKGDGDWFKIAYSGPASDSVWSTYNKFSMNFRIPKTTPPGKYLLRMEHIYLQYLPGETQFYIACAHVNVIGPGGGKPTDFVRFPGAYNASDPGEMSIVALSLLVLTFLGIMVTKNQFSAKDLLKYKPPGPPVWLG